MATPTPIVDNLVIGGGLAGSMVAIRLATAGRNVTVLEKEISAHHKVCGEFLSAEAQALAAYLGLDLAAMGATSITTFRLASGPSQAEAPLPFRGAGLSRFRLDQALLDAAEAAGAEPPDWWPLMAVTRSPLRILAVPVKPKLPARP